MGRASRLASRPGITWTVLGALLVAAACVLVVYNMIESNLAADTSARVLAELGVQRQVAGEDGAGTLSSGEPDQPLYEKFPDLEMPTVEVDGYRYIGTLEVPAVDLKLPVMQACDESRLKVAPCRCAGSVYRDDMVIAAHNYASHFGKLFSIDVGDKVLFTDVDGNRFSYRATGIEVIDPYDVAAMTQADGWDLTLFTCTYGGRTRYTVRCERAG